MNFDQYAKSYKNLVNENIKLTGESWDYFVKNKARFVARQLPEKFSGTVLDYGCGVGALSRELKLVLPGSTVDGYDVSTESVKLIPPDVSGQGMFTSKLDDLKPQYDVIVVSGVFHHVNPEKRQAIALEIADKLKKDGQAIIIEHNPFNPLTRFAVSQCEFDQDAILVSARKLVECLISGGLKTRSTNYMVFFPRFLSWFRPLEIYLSWCPLGATYALISGK